MVKRRTRDTVDAPQRPAKLAKNVAHAGMPPRALAYLPKLAAPDRFMFCIVSKGRAANVPKMEKLFHGTGVSPTWVVGKGEVAAYVGAGGSAVHEGGGLCPSRNMALDLARQAGKLCVQCSDDVSSCRFSEAADEWVANKEFSRPADMQEGNARAKAAEKYTRATPPSTFLVMARV